MLYYLFAFIVLLHGLIQLMGFARAYAFRGTGLLTREISKAAGLVWLSTAMLFTVTVILLLVEAEGWWMVGLATAILSQVLLKSVWKEAKYGTIANILIIVVCLYSIGS